MARKRKRHQKQPAHTNRPAGAEDRASTQPPRPRPVLKQRTSTATKIASLLVLVVIIILILILFYRVMASFVLPLFLAALCSVLFRPIHTWMLNRFRGREALSAGLTTAAILGIVLMPLVWIGSMAVGEALDLRGGFEPNRIVQSLNKLGQGWPLYWKGRPFQPHIAELDRIFADLPTTVPDPATDKGLVEPIRNALRRCEFLLGRSVQGERLESKYGSVLDVYERLAKRGFDHVDTDLPSETAVKIMIEKGWIVVPSTKEDQASTDSDTNGDTTETPLKPQEGDTEKPDEVRVPALESLIADLALSLDYLRSGDEWTRKLSELRNPITPIASEEEFEKNRQEIEDIEHNLGVIRTNFPRLNQNWRTVRAQLHGGTVRMIAHDILFPTQKQIDQAYQFVEEFGFRQLTTLPTKATALAGQFLAGTAVMILGIFYFLKDGPGMIRAVMRLSPLDDRYEKELLSEFDSVSRAVVAATLLSAFAQGILSGFGYYFAGFESILLLSMMTMLIAMVPVVGAAAVWLPACIWLAVVDNRIGAAIGLALYGTLVISMVDNLIKPFVLHGQSNLHPLLALLSVLGGVSALGPIGIIVGPMVVSFLQALLNMLHLELQEFDRQVDTAPLIDEAINDST